MFKYRSPGQHVGGFLFLECNTLNLKAIMKFLIAGLGNIGPEYELTRHNIGFLVLDQLADQHKARLHH